MRTTTAGSRGQVPTIVTDVAGLFLVPIVLILLIEGAGAYLEWRNRSR